MNVSEAVTSRRSVRKFLPNPVDPAVIRRILNEAGQAPSGGNLQPWHVEVIGGTVMTALKAAMVGRKLGDEPAEYAIYPAKLPDPFATRRYAIGEAMYGALGILREDRQARRDWFARNFQFFGAPAAFFIHTPRFMGPPQWSDLGMYLQTVMLLAREHGLDTCPQECWAMFPETVRRHVPIPPDHILFCGMAIGYRDDDASVNRFDTTRIDPAEFIRFHDI